MSLFFFSITICLEAGRQISYGVFHFICCEYLSIQFRPELSCVHNFYFFYPWVTLISLSFLWLHRDDGRLKFRLYVTFKTIKGKPLHQIMETINKFQDALHKTLFILTYMYSNVVPLACINYAVINMDVALVQMPYPLSLS